MSTFTKVAHGLTVNDRIYFGNVIPSDAGVEEGVVYYVLTTPDADTFTISETEGGSEFDLTFDVEDATVSLAAEYVAITDPADVMAPPVEPAQPDPPILSSLLISGVVRLQVILDPGLETTIRGTELGITHKFDSNGDPEFDQAAIFMMPAGSEDLTIPALGGTVYAVRARHQDVFGNYSPYSDMASITTTEGADGIAALISDIANDIPDGIVTEVKIADNAVTAPKIVANAIAANHLAATIVLASLLQTAESGRRVEFDSEGIRLYDTDEALLVRIPTNGDPVYVQGQIDASALVTNDSAEFRVAASVAGGAVLTAQTGVSDPPAGPVLAVSLPSLALTSTPPNLGHGIDYDSAEDTFWLAADPSTSDYVAHEYDAVTGALIRSIPANGTTETITATLGSTSHVSDTAQAEAGSTDDQVATPLTMPRDGRIISVRAYLAGFGGSATCRMAVWSSGNTLLKKSGAFTATSRAFANGNSDLYNKDLESALDATEGTTYRVGFFRTAGDFQWDKDDGAGKTTYLGDGDNGDLSGVSTDTNSKPNVSLRYEYDVDTRLEAFKMIGVATDGTHVYTLDSAGDIWKYDRTTLEFVASNFVGGSMDGTLANAGLFYDSNAGLLVITTTTGTTASEDIQFVLIDPSDLSVDSVINGSGAAIHGTSDTIRGGARLVDALNGATVTYWVPISGTVKAFVASTGALVADRDFGVAASCLNGLTWDGGAFRGWAVATPTKVWEFTGWDWTTASAIYWWCYAWYDSAGTPHETGVSPRTSVIMRRRERIQVTTPAIPAGGADDPNNVRVYTLPNATDPGSGASYKRQVTDALAARFFTDYDSGGSANAAASDFPAGTPAELRSALAVSSGGWSLKGDGTFHWKQGTAFPASPATSDRFFRTDLGMEFFYDGTRWLSTQLFTYVGGPYTTSATYALNVSASAAAAQRANTNVGIGTDIWLEDVSTTNIVNSGGTALGASHNWVGTLNKISAANAATSLGTVTINSGTSAPTWHTRTTAINALLGTYAAFPSLRLDWVKTGTPGDLSIQPGFVVTYRIVQT